MSNNNEDRCCGNCFWFSDEDLYGYGFCEEYEKYKSCNNYCTKWHEIKERYTKEIYDSFCMDAIT